MMDVATSCLVVFQVSVFILPMDKIDGQPLYEHPREYPLKASEANSCYQQIYGEEMKSAGKKMLSNRTIYHRFFNDKFRVVYIVWLFWYKKKQTPSQF